MNHFFCYFVSPRKEYLVVFAPAQDGVGRKGPLFLREKWRTAEAGIFCRIFLLSPVFPVINNAYSFSGVVCVSNSVDLTCFFCFTVKEIKINTPNSRKERQFENKRFYRILSVFNIGKQEKSNFQACTSSLYFCGDPVNVFCYVGKDTFILFTSPPYMRVPRLL